MHGVHAALQLLLCLELRLSRPHCPELQLISSTRSKMITVYGGLSTTATGFSTLLQITSTTVSDASSVRVTAAPNLTRASAMLTRASRRSHYLQAGLMTVLVGVSERSVLLQPTIRCVGTGGLSAIAYPITDG